MSISVTSLGKALIRSTDQQNFRFSSEAGLPGARLWKGGRSASDSPCVSGIESHAYCLGTPDYNKGMIKLALALGMKEEGRKRCAFFKAGKYHDIVLFAILSNEMPF